jgi:RHS repeat-associated protein
MRRYASKSPRHKYCYRMARNLLKLWPALWTFARPLSGSVIGVTTAVSAHVTAPEGQTISGWTVTLAPLGEGTPTVLAETTAEHPSTLATIDPERFKSGTYTLTIEVHASGGGYATSSATVTLGIGVAPPSEEHKEEKGKEEPKEEEKNKEETKEEESKKEEHKEEKETTQVATPPEIGEVAPASGTIVTDPTPIKAHISAPSGESIASWAVAYQGTEQHATTFASGKGTPPEALATFDPTKLANGDYKITVTATTTSGGVQSESTSLTVSGNLKLGRYLETETECLFGEPTESELGEEEPSGLCAYAYESRPKHTVTVTLPDGQTEVFVFEPHGEYFNNLEVLPRFTAKAGTNTTSTLEVDEPTEILNGFDGYLYDGDFENPWTAQTFLLTTRAGVKYVLNTEHGLISEEDLSHDKITFTANGIESSTGPKLTFTRDSQGRITEITGPSEQHLHYGYDAAGDLTSYTDADGNTITYAYDSDHDLLTTTGPGASRPLQTLRYNAEGRLEEAIGADGSVEHLSTNVGARTETIANPNGKLTTVDTFDQRGDLLEETKAFEGKTLTTTHTYDAEGHLLATTEPEGRTSSNEWKNGNLASHTDADGDTTSYEYDASGRLVGVYGPGHAKQVTITRDAEGQPTRIERAGGSTYTYTYTYDTHGNPTSITDPSGAIDKITYDSNGYPATSTDAAGETHTTYNASGQLTEEVAPNEAKTSYGYDANGNLTSITDGNGHTTTFSYDAFGHQVTATDPLGRTETSTYDEAGRLVKRVDRDGESTTYGYDADGNLVQEASADGEETSIGYNALEQPTSIANNTQTLGFTYDGDGRVTTASTGAVGAAPATTLSYTYDPDGNVKSVTGPDGTTSYEYDSLSRLTSLTPSGEPGGKSFELGYTPAGQLESLKRPDGVDDALSYEGERLLSRTSTLGSSALAGTTYTYGPTGLRASATESDGSTTSYAYDPLDELTEETPSVGAPTRYAYDHTGNRRGSYEYDEAEELTTDGTANYSYDADGQLIKRTVIATGATTTYEWNARHELSAVHLPNGSTESFAYDPLGRRVSVTDGSKTTSYVYDGANVHLEYEGHEPAAPTAVYTDGLEPNQVLEMARGGHRYSYLVDGQGSTIALADEHGNVVQRYSYDAFGDPSSSGSVANPFLYTGQQWEPESGLYYYGARYYAPALGRFISRDPVLHSNPYPYVDNDPINETDPTGRQGLEEEDAAIADESILEDTELPSAQDELDAFERTEGQSLDQLVAQDRERTENLQAVIGDRSEAETKAANFVDQLNKAEQVGRVLDPAQPSLPFTEGASLLQKGLVFLAGVTGLELALEEGYEQAFGE